MKDFFRITPIFFAAAVFSLAWRDGNVEASYIPKPFELLVVGVSFLVLLEIALSGAGRIALRAIRPGVLLYGLLLVLLTVFMAVSTWSSLVSSTAASSFIKEIGFEYAREFFTFFLFFITIYISFKYREHIKLILYSFAASSLVFYLGFLPSLRGIFVDNFRLIGANNDPNYTASYIAVGALILSALFLYKKSREKWIGAVGVALLMPLFLWANSRGMSVSLAVSIILLFALYIYHRRTWRDFGKVALLSLVMISSLAVSFALFDDDVRVSIYRRTIAPVLLSDELRAIVFGAVAEDREVVYSSPLDNFGLSRGDLWKSALAKVVWSPLGYGPAYHHWSPVQYGTGAHTLWFQVPLTAGWGGLLVWLVFIAAVLRDAVRVAKQRNFVGVSLIASFVFLLVSGIFIDMFTLRWLWLIMGMIVGYSILKENEKTKTESLSSSADL